RLSRWRYGVLAYYCAARLGGHWVDYVYGFRHGPDCEDGTANNPRKMLGDLRNFVSYRQHYRSHHGCSFILPRISLAVFHLWRRCCFGGAGGGSFDAKGG